MTLLSTTSYYFQQPWWLLLGLAALPMLWLARRNLATLGMVRGILACILRLAVVALLGVILARPAISRTNDQLTVIAVMDRSKSVPQELQAGALEYLRSAAAVKDAKSQLAVVDVAEFADIMMLPSVSADIRQRNTSLDGLQSRLASGVEMAMAIAPPSTAGRILLISDGNETAGDLRQTARSAAANGIPIDVLPRRYRHQNEVIFRNLVAPVKARTGQTVPLRFVLTSTVAASGTIYLSRNGQNVGTLPVELKPGTNVCSLSAPVGTGGVVRYEADFKPADPKSDSIDQNNHAAAVTFVAGPGHTLVLDGDAGVSGGNIVKALEEARIQATYQPAGNLTDRLIDLMDCDCIILANVDSSSLTVQQQDMLSRYVTETGGGLIMVGGPNGFGAGGWIGSPVAAVMPVEMDPHQKKQMPKGALALVMHACEMPDGNHWGKEVAIAAVKCLSQRDLVGVLDYGGQGAWVYPLAEVGDRSKPIAAIKNMTMGDMPDFGTPLQAAYDKLAVCDAAARHVIIISDGDPQPPSAQLLAQYKAKHITITTVAVSPHEQSMPANFKYIADYTGGRNYLVSDPKQLPQIFIKEAQVVRRALIVEETFQPVVKGSYHDLLRGISAMPKLEGYVLTEPRGGTNELVLANSKGDPLLAAGHFGLGRTIAFTSSADARWANDWLGWGGFARFWEQAVRWAGKSSQKSECDILADVQGQDVTLTVESVDAEGKFVQFSQVAGQTIAPDMSVKDLSLAQVGPGRYRGNFRMDQGGAYLVNIRYKKAGPEGGDGMAQTAVIVSFSPEFADLTDNAGLLEEIAAMTGGRVLDDDPAKAGLFSTAGVKFPRAVTPILTPLLFAWLALFLLDVAVRRVAFDLMPAVRWLGRLGGVFARGQAKTDATLERLKAKREETAKQLRRPSAQSGQRYQPKAGAEMPTVASETPPPDVAGAQPAAPAKPPPPPPPKQDSHLDQLLKAKRRTGLRKGDKEKE